ncbi:MAG: DUF3343 domain-containing protein [Spirochaetes bacterium]|nr:DUF3343 domain-containing protein [Spirochaetota bacterium]
MPEYSVILFYSNNHSIGMSNILKKNGIEHKMIPIPRHLSSDCGYCIRVENSKLDNVIKLIEVNSVEFDRIEKI